MMLTKVSLGVDTVHNLKYHFRYQEYRLSDPLSDIVALLQPSAPYSKVASGAGRWRVDREGQGQAFYCVIMEGRARLAVAGHEPLVLLQGDFVLVPAAYDFSVTSVGEQSDGGISPLTVTLLEGETRHGDPEGPADVRMLVGHFVFGTPDAALLVSLLPRLLHVRGEARLSTIVGLVTDEARARRPAGGMVLARLLEVMLLEALRSARGDHVPAGILRGLRDDRLAAAIRCMHAEPARNWTVDELAGAAALSRAAFFNRFRRALGVTPMDYLLGWRMAIAKNLLRQPHIAVQDIAGQVGYGSASAFSSAFTRAEGMAPSRYAEQVQAGRDKSLAA